MLTIDELQSLSHGDHIYIEITKQIGSGIVPKQRGMFEVYHPMVNGSSIQVFSPRMYASYNIPYILYGIHWVAYRNKQERDIHKLM